MPGSAGARREGAHEGMLTVVAAPTNRSSGGSSQRALRFHVVDEPALKNTRPLSMDGCDRVTGWPSMRIDGATGLSALLPARRLPPPSPLRAKVYRR